MSHRLIAAVLLACAAPLGAQAPATAPAAPPDYSSDFGFTYKLPAEWELLDMKPALAALQQQVEQTAGSDEEKREAACAQIALTAHHGDPTSMVLAMVLPAACVGTEITEKDLPRIGASAATGITQAFDVTEPVIATYSLGTHSLWIERANGNPKGHPEAQYKVETVCGILKKGAVCWMALAADEAALAVFEHATVALDGEAAVALVPGGVLGKKAQ